MDNNTTLALKLYKQYINQEQYSLLMELDFLRKFNMQVKRYDEAEKFLMKAYELDPSDKEVNNLLSIVRRKI